MPYQTSRRSGRLSKTIPILLIGASTEGRVFSEKTQTVVISLHGAGILSRNTFVAEQELILRSLETNREAAIRVLGEIGSQSGLYSYGVAFVDEQLDFWKVNFPPPPTSKAPREPLYLECSTCKAPVLLEHGDFEFDVCAIHGGLVRYCAQCSIATVWRLALQPAMPDLGILFPEGKSVTAAASPASAKVAAGNNSKAKLLTLDLPGESIPEPQVNRRIHRRARVNYCACVRTREFGDDIVACIDMSRGGVALKTKHPYILASEILIAVPYSRESPHSPAIFVSARIATRTIMPDNDFFRCGVQLIPVRAGSIALR
jgi:hypothetical protein